MPTTLADSLNLVNQIRAENGASVAHLNDQELADLAYNQTNDERLAPAARSSALQRGIYKTGAYFSELGHNTEQAIADEKSPLLQRIGGRIAGNLISGAPELAAGVGSAYAKGIPRALLALGGSGYVYGKTKAETNDEKAALGSGAGYLLGLLGGVKGAQAAERVVGEGAKPITRFAAGTLGGAVGQAPGDYLSQVSQPGETLSLEKFSEDPLNWPSYLLGQPVTGAALHVAAKAADLRKLATEKTKAATPDFDTTQQLSDADRYVQLSKKPQHSLTELELEEKRQLARNLAKTDEQIVASKAEKPTAEDIINGQETDATIRSQLYLLNQQKKAVVELPKGQSAPNMPEVMQGYMSYDSPINGNTYFYDERKTNPAQIDQAIKTNTLGYLLGYGVPSFPALPSGEVAVLRGKYGNEKAAVVLDEASKQSVIKSLGEMASGDDKVSIESPEQVMKWRQGNRGVQKLYSLSNENAGDGVSFTNKVLDLFNSSLQTKQRGTRFKGPRFQVDQNGQLGGKGLYQAVKDWAPAEIWDHYKQKGIEALLSVNKVDANGFADWLRENTPEVEVKKLIPWQDERGEGSAYAQAQHLLESQGFHVTTEGRVHEPAAYGSGLIDQAGGRIADQYGQRVSDAINTIYSTPKDAFEANTDAATGRYGVEPKELKDMPGAVDILVRIPERPISDFAYNELDAEARKNINKRSFGLLYQGPHFGESDVNVLASIRGYNETLPNGEKVFHVFEVQSDWGQQVTREGNTELKVVPYENGFAIKSDKTGNYVSDFGNDVKVYENKKDADNYVAARSKDWRRTQDHPLLHSYETLALKTAIQHARDIGAKYIAISDAETAMMTEGHDRYGNIYRVGDWAIVDPQGRIRVVDSTREDAEARKLPGDTIRQVTPEDSRPSQEPGMRAAYDQRLPAIAQKLTRDKGSKIDFGRTKNADYLGANPATGESMYAGSPVFKDTQGRSKSNVTARLYDITNPSPEVGKLFSLYDADKQMSFEKDLQLDFDKLKEGQRDPSELTPAQLLERSIQGDKRVERDSLLNFLSAIKGERGVLREGTFLSPKIFASIDLPTHDIKVNKDITLRVNEAFSKLAHELTHGAVNEMSPEQYQNFIDVVNKIGQPARLSILSEIKKNLKLGDKFDPDYLSGNRFDPNEQGYADRVAHEFAGGLMEAAAEAHFNKQSTSGWMKYLPEPVQKLLKIVVGKLKKYFGQEMPSISSLLSDETSSRLGKVVDSLQKNVIDAEQANLRALLNLGETKLFDENNFINQLTDRNEQFKNLPKGGQGELFSLASDIYNGVKNPIKDRFENFLLPALWRARIKPETAGHFWALHNFRPSNISDSHSYLSYLGQTEGNTLSREQALERWAKFTDSTLNNTGSVGQKFREAMGKIQEENQNRREASPVDLTNDKLVSKQEMTDKYGLSPEQAEYAQRLVNVSQLIAKESQRKARQVDNINLTRLFYAANKNQDLEGVRQKVARISRITEDAGNKHFELESRQKQLEKLRAQSEPDLDQEAEVQQEIANLTSQEDNFKTLLDRVIRQEFAGAIPMKLDGPDPFVNRMINFMINLSARRAQIEIMTGSAGWASMTRRGRFRLRVWDNTDLGDEFASVKEYKGFHSEQEMNDYIKSQGLTEDQYETFDMNKLKDRVRGFTPSKIRRAQEMAHQQFDQAIAEVESKASGLPPEQAAEWANAIADIKASFNPLESEMKDVISVKGDKFGERRYNIAGYDINDFLPNLFEYMQYKTVAGNKALAEAESNLQIDRKELENQTDLRERMKREQQYVLTSQKEWNNAKKLVFYYYLGANFRHILQNAVQIPLNGISQMQAEGVGGLSSYKYFSQAAKAAFDYGRKGTTGDKTIDILLKQAEKDGISFSTAIEAPLHESVELQNILDSINANADGEIGFGTKLKIAGTKVEKNIEKFLQVTSAAAESANRKTSFIASILAERARGVQDSAQLYDRASKFTNFVNFVGDKPNRPGYMIEHGGTPIHGPLGLLTALQSFTINHIGQLYSFYEKGFKQGSSADKKAFATGLAHLLVFAGSMGMVGVSTAEQLFEEVTGVSLKTAMREKMVDTFGEGNEHAADRVSDAVLYGFPALLDIDASNSIGLGSPLIRYQAGEPMTADQFLGPAAGMIGRVATGVGQVTADPFNPQAWWAATRSASPSFLTNAIRTYELLNSGNSLDKNQQPIGDPLDTSGSVAALTGFTPMETSKQRELNSRIYKETKKSAANYEQNVLRISQLINDYQNTGNTDSLLRANDMFSSYIDSVSGLQDRDSMINSIGDQLQQNRGKVTRAASLKESETRQKLEKAFPSLTPRYPKELDSALDNLEVAQLLGQDDVLARMMASLPSAAQHKALVDLLMEAGLRPEEAGLYQAPQKLAHLGR